MPLVLSVCQFVVGAHAMAPITEDRATFAFAGVALAVICHFDVVLDGPLLARILEVRFLYFTPSLLLPLTRTSLCPQCRFGQHRVGVWVRTLDNLGR